MRLYLTRLSEPYSFGGRLVKDAFWGEQGAEWAETTYSENHPLFASLQVGKVYDITVLDAPAPLLVKEVL